MEEYFERISMALWVMGKSFLCLKGGTQHSIPIGNNSRRGTYGCYYWDFLLNFGRRMFLWKWKIMWGGTFMRTKNIMIWEDKHLSHILMKLEDALGLFL